MILCMLLKAPRNSNFSVMDAQKGSFQREGHELVSEETVVTTLVLSRGHLPPEQVLSPGTWLSSHLPAGGSPASKARAQYLQTVGG